MYLVLVSVELSEDCHSRGHFLLAIGAFEVFVVIIIEKEILKKNNMLGGDVRENLIDRFGKVEIESFEVSYIREPMVCYLLWINSTLY